MEPLLRNMVGGGGGGGRNDKNIDYVICQRLLTDSSP